MSNATTFPEPYQVEVSGWNLVSNFFVERTELIWSQNGEKKVRLRHVLPDEAIIFVRLLIPVSTGSSGPVAYRVKSMQPMDRNGQCELLLTQILPRSKESIARNVASYKQGILSKMQEPSEGSAHLEAEETIQ